MKCCDINTQYLKKLHTQYLGLRDTPNFSIDFISEYCNNDVINTSTIYKAEIERINKMNMPKILNVTTEECPTKETIKHIDKTTKPYTVTYEEKEITYVITHIEWDDDTETTSKCTSDEFNAYVGFAICVAKKAMGNDNTMSNLADYWTIKVPKKREQEAKIKAEKQRLADKHKAEKEARFEHRKNKKLMMDRVRAYEAYMKDIELRKEVESKYGVPAGFNVPNVSNDYANK